VIDIEIDVKYLPSTPRSFSKKAFWKTASECKAEHSTTQCSCVLEEVVDYYVRNASSVCLVLLDASRAFDRIQYVKLFRLLLKCGLCSLEA
jgi:hypothetical protein